MFQHLFLKGEPHASYHTEKVLENRFSCDFFYAYSIFIEINMPKHVLLENKIYLKMQR